MLQGLYKAEFCAVSHCWDEPGNPDPTLTQLQMVVDFVRRNPSIRWVWFDFWCMPQGPDRSDADQAEFDRMLPEIDLVFLGASVHVLLDLQYGGRFWTQYEAWLSLQVPTPGGLRPARTPAERRCTITCIHGAREQDVQNRKILEEKWAEKTPAQAHQFLSGRDVKVTNASDKAGQLPKIAAMDAMVRRWLTSYTWYGLERTEAGVAVTLHESAQSLLAAHAGPLNVVAVCGEVGTGKSYLVNALLDEPGAFGVSPRTASFTLGVHVSSRLYAPTHLGCRSDAPRLAVVDMEGQGDRDVSYDVKLASLALLVSKVMIVNVLCGERPRREKILETLGLMMHAARRVSSDRPRENIFGHLHVVLRDCSNDETECRTLIFNDERDGSADAERRNEIRASVTTAFESVTVWCLPKLPTSSPPPADYKQNAADYVRKVDEMRVCMAGQLEAPKLLDGTALTGRHIAELLETLAVQLNDAADRALNPHTLMQAVYWEEAMSLREAGVAKAKLALEVAFGLKAVEPTFPADEADFQRTVDRITMAQIQEYDAAAETLPEESREGARAELHAELRTHVSRVHRMWEEATESERLTQQNARSQEELARSKAEYAALKRRLDAPSHYAQPGFVSRRTLVAIGLINLLLAAASFTLLALMASSAVHGGVERNVSLASAGGVDSTVASAAAIVMAVFAVLAAAALVGCLLRLCARGELASRVADGVSARRGHGLAPRKEEAARREAEVRAEMERAQGECSFLFLRADYVRSLSGPLMACNDVHGIDGALSRVPISRSKACRGHYVGKFLIVSHRWESVFQPDSEGHQLCAMQDHLRAHPEIEYVWYDYACMWQGRRTPAQMVEFGWQLSNVVWLYIGMSVLILLDLSYISRFWTQFEAWVSMQMATEHGLVPAPDEQRRYTIVPILNANAYIADALVGMWRNKTPQEAMEVLAQPDVVVTNQKDKMMQISKLRQLDAEIKDVMREQMRPPPPPLARSLSRGSGVLGVGSGKSSSGRGAEGVEV